MAIVADPLPETHRETGRPTTILCADIGGSYIDLALIGDDAAILARHTVATPCGDWQAFVGVFEDMAAMVRPASDTVAIPISIATAGLVDPTTGMIAAANIPALHGRSLAADLSTALGRPVRVMNDADAFTLAEARVGAGVGHMCVLGIVLGTGVGGGIVRDGRLVAGPGGSAGEWGHGQIIHASPRGGSQAMPLFRCGCGRMGCLETVSGARGLERLHHFLHGDTANSHVIVARWLDGDAAAGATIDYFVEITGGAITMLVNTLGATIVPVGGGLANVGPLVERLDTHVRRNRLAPSPDAIVRRSAIAATAGLIGAYFNEVGGCRSEANIAKRRNGDSAA